jgi:hypothetical protein
MKQLEFPPHHQLYITHNGHRVNYESIKQYLDAYPHKDDMSESDIKECIENDEIWEIQLYPVTPISFYWVAAATLERAIELIWETEK